LNAGSKLYRSNYPIIKAGALWIPGLSRDHL